MSPAGESGAQDARPPTRKWGFGRAGVSPAGESGAQDARPPTRKWNFGRDGILPSATGWPFPTLKFLYIQIGPEAGQVLS